MVGSKEIKSNPVNYSESVVLVEQLLAGDPANVLAKLAKDALDGRWQASEKKPINEENLWGQIMDILQVNYSFELNNEGKIASGWEVEWPCIGKSADFISCFQHAYSAGERLNRIEAHALARFPHDETTAQFFKETFFKFLVKAHIPFDLEMSENELVGSKLNLHPLADWVANDERLFVLANALEITPPA